MASFAESLQARFDEDKIVCINLDSDVDKLPPHLISKHLTLTDDLISDFHYPIVDKTKDLVCAYKLNLSFYEGKNLLERALWETVHMIHSLAPGVPIIGDAKRANVGEANEFDADLVFGKYDFDAVTVNPYLGSDPFKPYIECYPGKGLFVVCRTTNPNSSEIQNMPIGISRAQEAGLISDKEREILFRNSFYYTHQTISLYEMIAFLTAHRWNEQRYINFGLVMGAIDLEAVKRVRKIAPDLPLLIPGIGEQLGNLEVVKYASDYEGKGMIIASGRSIIYASSGEDFAQVAREKTLELHNRIAALRS